MAVQWQYQTQKTPATTSEIEALTSGLNAANLYPLEASWEEVLRGSALFAACYVQQKIGNYELDRVPLAQPVHIPNEDFLEKVRYGIAMMRFFIARPDKFNAVLAAASPPDRWWRNSNYTGYLRQEGYMPPVWWQAPAALSGLGVGPVTSTLITEGVRLLVDLGVAWYASRAAQMGQEKPGAQANLEEVAMLTNALMRLNVFPENPDTLQLPIQVSEQGTMADIMGWLKEWWPIAAAGGLAVLALSWGGERK